LDEIHALTVPFDCAEYARRSARRDGLRIVEQLSEQLAHLQFRCGKRTSARGCDSINATSSSVARLSNGGPKVAACLEPMQDRIERTSTHSIAVPSELVDHAQTKNRRFGRVMENVQSYQAGEEVSIAHGACLLLSNFVIEER
jgi:hypothetical protein